MNHLTSKSGSTITLQTMIVDIDQLSMRQVSDRTAMERGFEAIKIFENHYPESLRRVFVINAPRLFATVFNMLKSMLSEVTLNKIRVYGTDRDQWMSGLKEDISE